LVLRHGMLVCLYAEKSNFLDSGKGQSAQYHPLGGSCREPTPSAKISEIDPNLSVVGYPIGQCPIWRIGHF